MRPGVEALREGIDKVPGTIAYDEESWPDAGACGLKEGTR
jgi:hypothetical protein